MKTANHIEVKNATDALRLAMTAERAAKLLSEGYTFSYEGCDAVAVCKPGRLAASYIINIHTGECDCPDFQNPQHKDFCKHTLCWAEIESERQMWEAICAEEEARAAREF